MTQRLVKVKTDKVRDPNSKLVTNGPKAQTENKHSSPDKIRRLQYSLNQFKHSTNLFKHSSNQFKHS